ncbi:hypothetical protein [Agriterribacter humi]|jgi:hypothetical protein|uniref:hypothetical protein n=1 Tax=Agriterribacter humi TaxID=1104781 RepID=UPI001264F417|nr:hypothetical protein [Agriterribacter humi]
MFTQTWKKYLPVIVILLKRSAGSEQKLSMNHTDFERATGGRKIKFSFTQLQLNKGRINSEIKQAAVAKELADLLREDAVTKKLIAGQYLEFSLSNDFQLSIKNNTPLAEATVEAES